MTSTKIPLSVFLQNLYLGQHQGVFIFSILFVRMHHFITALTSSGTVWIISVSNEGSCFSVTILIWLQQFIFGIFFPGILFAQHLALLSGDIDVLRGQINVSCCMIFLNWCCMILNLWWCVFVLAINFSELCGRPKHGQTFFVALIILDGLRKVLDVLKTLDLDYAFREDKHVAPTTFTALWWEK